jgi:hypothetical protein
MNKESKEAEDDPIVFKCLDGNSAVAHVSYRINDTAVGFIWLFGVSLMGLSLISTFPLSVL